MPDATTAPAAVADFLSEHLRVGEPMSTGPLTVVPLFGPEARCEYLSFAESRAQGVRIGELEAGASVRDLVIENPSPSNVLLFEGEEVLGAQQNRTFDVSVLVGAGQKLRVPVSCVEAGRWDGSRHGESFEPAPQTANPRLRREKAEQARRQVMAGAEARADQSAVWSSVSAMGADYGAHSPTGAMHDVYESRRDSLGEMCAAVPLRDGQSGSIVFVNGEMWVADFVSRPDAYASLHERLVQGYALDALGAGETVAPAAELDEATARGVALLIEDSPVAHRTRGTGLGEEIRFAANGVSGTGLVHREELIQISVFRDEPGGEEPRRSRAGRVARPSRRRA